MKAHTIYSKPYSFYKHELYLYRLPLYLLVVLSAELLCNQNGHRSGRTKCRARSGPKHYVFKSHLMPIYMNRSRNGITFKFLPFIYITFVLGAQKNRLSRQAQ